MIQIHSIQGNRGNSWVVIGGVIIYSLVGVAAAAVAGVFKAVLCPYAAFGHGDGAENVEKLVYSG